MRHMLFDAFLRCLNIFIPKIKHSVFLNLGLFPEKNCEDLLNGTGSNGLTFINELIRRDFKEPVVLYIEYCFDDRLDAYKEIAKTALEHNIEIRFLKGNPVSKNLLSRLGRTLNKYCHLFRTKVWIVSTGDEHLHGKLKCQTIVNMNYYISCKNDFLPGHHYRWQFLDTTLTTSLLASTTMTAQLGVKYDSCIELGFPRNDTLFQKHNKENIYSWLREELGYTPKKILVYAPTYRDYEKNADSPESRFLFGYPTEFLGEYLKKNQYCLVCKLHSLATESILKYPAGVIDFKYCFDFSFYDLMAVSDCVITDYSSLGYDFLLLNKPLLYNLYDYDKYVADRGLSYEPYEDFCPGRIVTNTAQLQSALEDLAKGVDGYEEKRQRLMRLFHKYPDGNSANRCVAYFCERFDLK